ncbi:MAG TPA: DUF1992 domain-containing protein [Citreicella sp.]|jgi:hypothetical protein|nr:DUF1992 domain-containing protein [Citreicella sp.]HBT00374.1 DUF1992 domain-containing protein [Citreicella sp.]
MDHPLIDLINARIAAAEARGEFDNLPGAGRPLPPCEDPENAVLHRLLRDNGAVPEAVALTRDLARLRETLRDTSCRSRRAEILREIALLDTKLDLARRRP